MREARIVSCFLLGTIHIGRVLKQYLQEKKEVRAHSTKQRPLWLCAKGLVFIDTCKRGQGQFQITHILLKFTLCICHYGLNVEAFPPGNGIIDF